jgi:hypothetical protein
MSEAAARWNIFMIELANLGDTLLGNSEVTRIKSLPNSIL